MASSSSNGAVARARQELRKLTDEVNSNRSAATSTRSNYLGKALDKGNVLYATLKHDARGAALDATFLTKTSALGAEQAGNLEKITPEKYISKLKAQFGWSKSVSTAIKWTELAAAVANAEIFTPAPAVTFIDGHFEVQEKKQRQKREKRARDEPEGPAQVAENVSVDRLKETAEEKAQVVRIKVLTQAIKKAAVANAERGGPKKVNLFQVLLHPTSFSQTVENFFDLAFLIKQGQTRLTADDEAIYVEPSKQPVADDYSKGTVVSHQNILKLDFPTYQRLVRRWCTPDRPPLLDRSAVPPAAEADDDDDDTTIAAAAAPPPPPQQKGKKGRAS